MALIGAEITEIGPGFCTVRIAYREDLTQQHGFFHGGIVGMLADNAAGYAAFTLFPEDAAILTVEYKINLLAPAAGEALVAEGQVIKPGRTLTVCDTNVYAMKAGEKLLVARASATLFCLRGRSDNRDGFPIGK